jgi:D-alanine-D-alanine ligase
VPTSFTSRLTIAVLSGGDSAERDISRRSGAAVAEALATAGHRVITHDPSLCRIEDISWRSVDACFIALHGGAGEDGRVQELLQRLKVPYTGSDPVACRLAMSKSASKQRFIAAGVPTPPFVLIRGDDSLSTIAMRVERLGYPIVVKPDGQGSSIGVAPVDSRAELDDAVRAALRLDALVVAESMIKGREFTVATIGERALPLVEITTPEPVFSYDAKYKSALTEYRLDFELPEEMRDEIAEAAVAAVRALGAGGLVRTDVMLGHDGRAWVLEVNAVPGLTKRSLAPLAAERAGYDLSELCDLLVRQCLACESVS